jgi:hypothetical protein
VLLYEGLLVIVEAKTDSAEHATPSGQMQTEAYPPATRNALGLPENTPTWMVFLTPDRRRATNEDAICTSYLDFAFALVAELNPDELSRELQFAFGMLFTHFLVHATPADFDSREALRVIEQCVSARQSGDCIADHLGMLRSARKVLLGDDSND